MHLLHPKHHHLRSLNSLASAHRRARPQTCAAASRKMADHVLKDQAFNVKFTGNYDVYQGERHGSKKAEWDLSGHNDIDQTYLKHVKTLANNWKHLRVLADFMEVGTDPRRWGRIRGSPEKGEWRPEKTKVRRLDYLEGGSVTVKPFDTSEDLKEGLRDGFGDHAVQFRLYAVEDVSREVIEHLGTAFDIEPDFFR